MQSRKAGPVCSLMLLVLVTRPVFAQEKLAQTGFQFLSVGTDARATALGEAFTTVDGSPVDLFYNPAGMAGVESFLEFSLNHMPWLTDINYYSGALSVNPEHGRYGVFGLSFLFVDYGNIVGTAVAANDQGFIETGDITPVAFSFGFGYSRALSDRFSVGGHLKFVGLSFGDLAFPDSDTTRSRVNFSESAVAIDFGTIYKTGFKSLTFGMTIRNFSREVTYISENFEFPLTFKIGFSIDAFDFLGEFEKQSFLLLFDAVNPRSLNEFFSIGGEYDFMDVLSLRAGYVANQDEYAITTGFGLRAYNITLDYSYTPFESFKDVHRFSVKFKL